jgi:hypothetical protein
LFSIIIAMIILFMLIVILVKSFRLYNYDLIMICIIGIIFDVGFINHCIEMIAGKL